MGWGKAKALLFESIDEGLKEPRREYQRLLADTKYIESVLKEGARKANDFANQKIIHIRKEIGIS